MALALVACADQVGDGFDRRPGDPDRTPTTFATNLDVVILRTASSLERLAIGVYDAISGLGVVETPEVQATIDLFRNHHRDHAALFDAATNSIEIDSAFTDSNPVIAARLRPRLAAIRTENDALKLAYEIETIKSSTYFSTVGSFGDRKLNQAVMSVGGIEARHVTVLGDLLRSTASPPYPADGFATNQAAVVVGTGV